MSAEDDFVQSLETFFQARLEDVHTMLPGRIVSYDSVTRLATVKPSVSMRSLHGDILDIPPIDSVPVVWPGSSDFSVSGELRNGDGVVLYFAESGLGGWLRGSEDAEADDETRFSLHDAIAVPGLNAISRIPLHPFRTAKWGMSSKGLEIGGTENDTVSIANSLTDLRAEIEKLWTAIGSLGDFAKILAPISSSPGNASVPNPAQVAAITAAQALWALDKLALRKILA